MSDDKITIYKHVSFPGHSLMALFLKWRTPWRWNLTKRLMFRRSFVLQWKICISPCYFGLLWPNLQTKDNVYARLHDIVCLLKKKNYSHTVSYHQNSELLQPLWNTFRNLPKIWPSLWPFLVLFFLKGSLHGTDNENTLLILKINDQWCNRRNKNMRALFCLPQIKSNMVASMLHVLHSSL